MKPIKNTSSIRYQGPSGHIYNLLYFYPCGAMELKDGCKGSTCYKHDCIAYVQHQTKEFSSAPCYFSARGIEDWRLPDETN
jgi:hypothetical protein